MEVPFVSSTDRLYFFNNPADLNERVRVDDDVSLRAFLQLDKLVLYILKSSISPGAPPLASPPQLMAKDLVDEAARYIPGRLASRGGIASAAQSVTSEGASTKRRIKDAILPRDTACVVCGESSPDQLQAAHIISHKAIPGVAMRYGIPSTESERNGMILCYPCHQLFDSYYWTVRSQKIVVSHALAQHPELGARWRDRIGALLCLGPRFRAVWPLATVLATHQREFALLEGEKPAERSAPPVCLACGVVLSTHDNLSNHASKCKSKRVPAVSEEVAGETSDLE